MSDDAVDTTESLILTSRLFRSKPQMKRLLTYLVKHTYKNETMHSSKAQLPLVA